MFERFTAASRSIIAAGQDEARVLRHGAVGPEHLLLGLLGLPGDPAAELLRGNGLDLPTARQAVQCLHAATGTELDAEALGTIGIDLDTVREKVEAVFGIGALSVGADPKGRRRWGGGSSGGCMPFTPAAKKSLELALREALALKSREILPGHVLLGLLRDADTPTARVVRDHGLELTTTRERIRTAVA